jgi:hypothetical protein
MTRRIPVWIVGLWWLAVGAVAAFACSGSVDDAERTDRVGIYTDEEVGVDALVDSWLADRHPFVRHRTDEERLEEMGAEASAEWVDFHSSSLEKRDRLFFEQQLNVVLFATRMARPEEIEGAEGALFDAFYDSVDLCAERSEYAGIDLYGKEEGVYQGEDGLYYPLWSIEEEAQVYDITVDEFLDLRHECHKFAASYPVLDGEHRDELLRTRRDYYLEILRLWLRDHPEMVVPLDYENSVNQPYQDYVRQQCMETEDPEACARDVGVSYR